MIVCTKCQHHNADTEKFCQRCGAFLEYSGKALDGPADPLPSPGSETAVEPAASVSEAPTTPGWATPSPDTVAIRPDEAGLDRAYVPTGPTTANAVGPGEIACPACGVGNPPTRTFCRNCGAELTAAPAAAVVALTSTEPADRRRLLLIIGTVVVVALVAGVAWALRPKDDNKSTAATATTLETTASTADDTTTDGSATTVAVTVPPTFAPAPAQACGTAYYADIGTDPSLAGWFLSGRLYAECAGEKGNVVSRDGYVLFPTGNACPDLGAGLMLIVFDQPTAVRSVQLQPSPSPTRNYRWPIQAQILGYTTIDTTGPTQPDTDAKGQPITRTSAKPNDPPAWTAQGDYDTKTKTLTMSNSDATPVKAIELQLLQYGDSPGRSGTPDTRCAVHRVLVTS